ncbi:MAG: hypothetical protein A3C55_05220 [Gammaproteobacteria bacterium RIFCSPHIGHO2_02_FULL_42_13]|nr:MAG: hypothetical protein A3C55_05220 [Gammaproteobacteria bacterium RIFCSPHIGHO2_02_FULL_42_13]OGT68318.1 MAG: hypothetical protein A3H43_01390 [Gammaproteobacteria bacterium RIFCSPLOWO2_02_FULL_42_9]
MKKYQLLAILAGGLLTLTCNAATTENATTTATAPVVAQADTTSTAPAVSSVKKSKKAYRHHAKKMRKIRKNKK